jgi:hypothetical protein
MWKAFVALLLGAAPAVSLAQENATAYEALRVIGAHFGRGAVNHVISMSGVDGNPQPETWRVLLENPRGQAGAREVEVSNGRIVSDHLPNRGMVGSTEGATIKTTRLNLDSSGAYTVASYTADKSNARFSTVSYTLRTDERGDPTWIVTLHGKSGRPVGTIHIGANRGNVTRTEGMFAGATMEDVQTDESVGNEDVDEDGGEHGIFYGPKQRIKASMKSAFRRAQDEARGMFDRVRRSFVDFINRG